MPRLSAVVLTFATALIAVLLAAGCATTSGGPVPARDTVGVTIGRSAKSRPLTASTVGRGPMRIYLVGGIHGDEPEGQAALDAIRREFATPQLAGQVTLRILDDLNPDGTAARTRGSAAGVDLNRNWPAANFRPAAARGRAPLSEPETTAAHADIVAFDPHVIVVLHSSVNGPYVNFDGPGAARSLAEQFARAASAAGPRWRVVPDMGYPTPGSMGSYFGKDRGLPILTIELRRGGPPAPIPAAVLGGMRAVAGTAALARVPLSRAKPVASAVASNRASPPAVSARPAAGPAPAAAR